MFIVSSIQIFLKKENTFFINLLLIDNSDKSFKICPLFFFKETRTKGAQGMAKASQLMEIQDGADLGTEKLPMKRCMGLNCNETVPQGTYFCPECATRKNSIRRVKEVSKGGRTSRVMHGNNSSREI
ncbi:MAG: hypothetical protein NT148_01445 [Candidatus Nealsonbacteria bacterium]|nr:hypothetical protein [Candidatus Nealsonbacteria bacterium]